MGIEIIKHAMWCPGLRPGLRLGDGLRGHWPIVEGGGDQIMDVSGNRHHGVLTNMTAADWISDTVGHGLDFDGSNDCADTNAYPAYTGTVTVAAMFIRGGGQGAGLYAIAASSNEFGFPGFYLAIYGNAMRMHVANTGAQSCNQRTSVLATGQRFLGVGTYDGATCHTYIDGVLDDGGPSADKANVDFTPGNDLIIGGRGLAGAYNNWLGQIFGVWYWDRALTAGEVAKFSAKPWRLTTPPTGRINTFAPTAQGVLAAAFLLLNKARRQA